MDGEVAEIEDGSVVKPRFPLQGPRGSSEPPITPVSGTRRMVHTRIGKQSHTQLTKKSKLKKCVVPLKERDLISVDDCVLDKERIEASHILCSAQLSKHKSEAQATGPSVRWWSVSVLDWRSCDMPGRGAGWQVGASRERSYCVALPSPLPC